MGVDDVREKLQKWIECLNHRDQDSSSPKIVQAEPVTDYLKRQVWYQQPASKPSDETQTESKTNIDSSASPSNNRDKLKA
ncbi:hypothetical protein ACLMJK_003985 [Lecanora helva]